MYKNYGKRLCDLFFSLIAFIILSPILGVIAILVRIKHGSPVLFSPTRPGKDEKIFHLYKFRTMSNAKDKEGILLPEKDRITKLGKFLRSSSLDELPELLNIIKGDMSIVGPRPLPMKYLPYYSERQRMRHSIRPGLTGLAQISGRNNLPWNQRFETDLAYVENLSLWNDILIIIKTVFKVFRGADVVIPGLTTFYQFDTYKVLEEEKAPHNKTGKMTCREIGSNFWITEDVNINCVRKKESTEGVIEWLPAVADSALTFSGRAAIRSLITSGSQPVSSQASLRSSGLSAYSCRISAGSSVSDSFFVTNPMPPSPVWSILTVSISPAFSAFSRFSPVKGFAP